MKKVCIKLNNSERTHPQIFNMNNSMDEFKPKSLYLVKASKIVSHSTMELCKRRNKEIYSLFEAMKKVCIMIIMQLTNLSQQIWLYWGLTPL